MNTVETKDIMKKRLIVLAVLLGMAQMGMADLLTPHGAIAGTQYDSKRTVENIINGTGLNFFGLAGEEGDYTKYQYLPSLSLYSEYTAWTGNEPSGGSADDVWAIIDLGSVCDIATISIFNSNPKLTGDTSRETQTLDVWVREDGGFSNSHLDAVPFNTTGWTLLTVSADMTLTRNPGGTTQTVADVLSPLTGVRGRYVALDINSNYGHGLFSLIGEVQVFGEVYIPESDLLRISNVYANYEIDASRKAEYLINGTGLLFNGAAGEEGDYRKYVYSYATGTGPDYSQWFDWTGRITAPATIDDLWVIADLGSVCELNALSIFNFNPASGVAISRATKGVDVWIREDVDLNNTKTNGVAFNTNGWTLVTVDNDMILKQNPGGTTQTVHNVISLNGINARMVALDINSNYGFNDMSAMGEVQIFGKLDVTNAVNVVPSSVIAYSEFSGGREAVNTINGSGVDFTGAGSEEGDYSKYRYLPDDAGEYATGQCWTGQPATNAAGTVVGAINDMWLIYDLGSERDILAISIFNFNPAESNQVARSVKECDLWVRSDAGFSNTNMVRDPFDETGWTPMSVGAVRLDKNPGGTIQSVHNVMAFADVTGRYVAVDINENYGDSLIVALGEVQFFCTPLPPVPQGTLLLLQ